MDKKPCHNAQTHHAHTWFSETAEHGVVSYGCPGHK